MNIFVFVSEFLNVNSMFVVNINIVYYVVLLDENVFVVRIMIVISFVMVNVVR